MELVQLNGRAVGLEEIDLSFRTAGAVQAVDVAPGQLVTAGQVLIRLDSKPVTDSLAAARTRLETGEIRYDQATARMRADLATSRRAAEAGVVTARNSLERAEADLARLYPTEMDRRANELQVAAAQLALHKALSDQERALAGYTTGAQPGAAGAISASNPDQQVAAAKAAVAAAQAELDKVTQPPDPLAVRAAERQVERANLSIMAAQAMQARPTPNSNDVSGTMPGQNRDLAIAQGRLDLENAQDQLNKLRAPPNPAAVEAARRKLQDAEEALAVAEERRGAAAAGVQQASPAAGPAQFAIDAANLEVERTRLALARAQEQVKQGPTEQQLAAAQTVLEAARTSLANAESQVEQARQREQSGVDESRHFDILLMEKSLDQDLTAVRTLEEQATQMTLIAPFSGIVTSVAVQPGSQIAPNKPAVVLARSGDPIIQAMLTTTDAARVAVGQSATVQLDGGDTMERRASVTGIGRNPSGAGSMATLRVAWGPNPPLPGATARASIVVQDKPDALLVPRRAVRTSGERSYVEVVEGETPQITEVILGTTSRNDAEILSGLAEGQTVVVGP